jgi:hypothetical protein
MGMGAIVGADSDGSGLRRRRGREDYANSVRFVLKKSQKLPHSSTMGLLEFLVLI